MSVPATDELGDGVVAIAGANGFMRSYQKS